MTQVKCGDENEMTAIKQKKTDNFYDMGAKRVNQFSESDYSTDRIRSCVNKVVSHDVTELWHFQVHVMQIVPRCVF